MSFAHGLITFGDARERRVFALLSHYLEPQRQSFRVEAAGQGEGGQSVIIGKIGLETLIGVDVPGCGDDDKGARETNSEQTIL